MLLFRFVGWPSICCGLVLGPSLDVEPSEGLRVWAGLPGSLLDSRRGAPVPTAARAARGRRAHVIEHLCYLQTGLSGVSKCTSEALPSQDATMKTLAPHVTAESWPYHPA